MNELIIINLKTLQQLKNLNKKVYKISDYFEENLMKRSLNENSIIKSESNVWKYCKISSEDSNSECETQITNSGHKLKATDTTNVDQEHKREFKCYWPGCNRLFKFQAHLDLHQCYHTGDKPFICEENNCMKRFSKKSNLTNHQKSCHSNDKQYVCLWKGCNKRFSTSGNLNVHQVTHSNEKVISLQYHWL